LWLRATKYTQEEADTFMKHTLRKVLTAVCLCAVVTVSSISHAALVGRLAATPGGMDYQAYYDTALNITWLADANAGAGSAFDDGTFATDGRMSWDNAVAWTTSLTVNGIGGWRLPDMDVNGDDTIFDCALGNQAACMDNEIGHLFYYGAGTTLGSGVTADSPSPFSNIIFGAYWSGTDYAPNPAIQVWDFLVDLGAQEVSVKGGNAWAWAVRSGDVGVVPVPAAVWLFGSGLLGLICIARRKKA